MPISHPRSPLYKALNVPPTPTHHGFPQDRQPPYHALTTTHLGDLTAMCAPCFNLYLDLYSKFPLRALTLHKHGRRKTKHPYLFTRYFPSDSNSSSNSNSNSDSESHIQLVLDLLRLGLQHAFPKTAAQIGVDSTVTTYSSSLSFVALSVVVDFPEKVAVNETVLQVLFGVEESKGWEVLDFRGAVEAFCECGGAKLGKGVKRSGSSKGCVLREWVL
ncbi:hypothetical protein BJY00DRAFT_315312 [Aspergillus carlsbadensis]|nr:hypothetical protein BJY00DRAFT_315312 [Aspergillus carlsbadensis]